MPPAAFPLKRLTAPSMMFLMMLTTPVFVPRSLPRSSHALIAPFASTSWPSSIWALPDLSSSVEPFHVHRFPWASVRDTSSVTTWLSLS